jgi:hypothetical protein
MMARISVAITLVLASPVARADDTVEGQAHFGVVTAPFDESALSEAKGQAFVFLLEDTHPLPVDAAVAVRIPLVIASVAQPAGSYVDTVAVGNPQLRGIKPVLRRSNELALSAGLDLGIPVAGHSTDLIANRALAIASGVEGLADPELFTPGVASITPFAILELASDRSSLAAQVRLPLLVRLSDADLPSAMTVTNAAGGSAVASVEGRRRLSGRFGVAIASKLAVELAPTVEHVRSFSRFQDLERATLRIRLGGRSALMIDLQAAIGGPLGGSCFGGGLRAIVGLP